MKPGVKRSCELKQKRECVQLPFQVCHSNLRKTDFETHFLGPILPRVGPKSPVISRVIITSLLTGLKNDLPL